MKRCARFLAIGLIVLGPFGLCAWFYWTMLPQIEVEASVRWSDREEKIRLIPPPRKIIYHEPVLFLKFHNVGSSPAHLNLLQARDFLVDGVSKYEEPRPIDQVYFGPPTELIPPGGSYEMTLPFQGLYSGKIVYGFYFHSFGGSEYPKLFRWGFLRRLVWTPPVNLPIGSSRTVSISEEEWSRP